MGLGNRLLADGYRLIASPFNDLNARFMSRAVMMVAELSNDLKKPQTDSVLLSNLG
jgi:hypothetical protein